MRPSPLARPAHALPALAALALICCAFTSAPAASAAPAPVVVSLQFDDSTADQLAIAPLLDPHGFKATYFVNSGRLGTPGYMSLAQVLALQAAGNEIGGHTLSHANLPTLDPDDQKREICDDRVALLADGLAVTDFAYPFGANDATTRAIAQACGYNSARTVSGIAVPGSCLGCAKAETIPPRDPYATRIPTSIRSDTTLDTIEGYVTQAQAAGGGWIQLLMHHLCSGDGCDQYSIDPATLSALADWLDEQRQDGSVVIRTVAQVIGGPVRPPVAGPPVPPPGSGDNQLGNPSLELDANRDALPDCWSHTQYGTNSGTWTRTSDAHTGLFADHLDMPSLTSGDRKLTVKQDTGTCSPTARPGHQYVVGGWYKASGQGQLVMYVRDSAGAWSWWAQSPRLAPSAEWRRATWTTAPLPAGTKAYAVAFALVTAGSMTVDDMSTSDLDQTPPAVTLTTPDDGSAARGTIAIAADASDASGIDHVEFTVAGQVVGTDSTAPYSINWDSTTVNASEVAVAARAVDTAGNDAVSATHRVVVTNGETTPPQTTITCSGAACPAGYVHGPLSVELSATDGPGGSGVDHIAYTTDGSDPTLGDGARYDQPITVTSTTHLRYRAWDVAGNAEDVRDVVLRVDPDPPASSITCNGRGCDAWQPAGVSVALAATDSGSGVGAIRFSTDGSDPAGLGGQVYTAPIAPGATTTFRYAATDQAGNAEAPRQQAVRVDGAAPQTSATCTPGPCGGWATGPVTVSLTATDAESGVNAIRFTTDGSDPLGPGASTYSDPFVLPASATIRFSAVDAVGNAEPARAQAVRIDAAAPTTTASCAGKACPAVTKATQTVTLTSADAGSGVGDIRYSIDGSTPTATSGLRYTAPFKIGSAATVTGVTVRWRAFDVAGNAEPVQSLSVVFDRVPPTAQLVAPLAGATVSGKYEVLAVPGDDVGVARVRFYLDGVETSFRTAAPWHWVWDTRTAAVGQHTIEVRSEDLATNLAYSGPVTVSVKR